jgi:hypothetical protein
MSVEEIYRLHIKPLPAADCLRPTEITAHDLTIQPAREVLSERHDWMSVRGIAPHLLNGEDAQEWVSRTRREVERQGETIYPILRG